MKAPPFQCPFQGPLLVGLTSSNANFRRNKSAPPRINHDSNLKIIETFESEYNPLVSLSTMRSTFLCQFKQVSIYPFGTEECWFQFYLKQYPDTKVNAAILIDRNSADFIGQYEVRNWSLTDVNHKHTGGYHFRKKIHFFNFQKFQKSE